MRLMRLKEAAEKLGVCVKTVRRWCDTGRIKCVRLPSGHRRIPEEEVEKILVNREGKKNEGD